MKAKILTTLLLALAVSPLTGQTAKVIQLSPDETKIAKYLYQQKVDIEAQIASFRNDIKNKYLVDKSDQNAFFISGWNWGFEFSTDFKFIVPNSYTPPSSNSCSCSSIWSNGCVYFTGTGTATYADHQ